MAIVTCRCMCFHFDCFWMKEFQWVDFEWDKRVFPTQRPCSSV